MTTFSFIFVLFNDFVILKLSMNKRRILLKADKMSYENFGKIFMLEGGCYL